MYPPVFEYVRPASLGEALRILEGREDAAPIAGGQSLIPLLKLRAISYGLLVDINRIPELRYARYGEVVELGALTRHYELEESPCPFLRQVAVRIGDVQIRSLGTLGGSLAHADPFGDWPAAMLALGAVVEVAGVAGVREVAIDDFIKGPYSTALERGELIVGVRFKCPERGAYVKFSRRHNDFAFAAVAVAGSVKDGHVIDVRIAALGAADRPVRLKKAEAVLAGAPLKPGVVAEAVDAARKEAEPPFDFRASAEYRRHLLGVALKRALGAL
ncbi:Aerobic-type carbon monoxide dehydrogenase, middle subunit CoxM/CutM-like protein [Pyrobaculum oguniense TE7]|uniref:Aerobic-type carbon monoxide dehydrogenase, middle subunit CoxM/CutM-like protein n=1 Tax=Pyrobaculum oguniense (strain DSM 13380 / JCM 10595 / TE7) TaxID=698757 RepID=H6Q6G9_PYROT|nr:Aerobic-type carbon monoxide dehydrogenase, middle subunit CoxM/CutM-like protein [Pyrobaculum oguniense TE7]